MQSEHIREMLDDAGCILQGNYFFSLKKPGLVSQKYVNIDQLLTYPNGLATICNALVKPFKDEFDCIVGPATGGIPIAYTCANEALHNGWFARGCGGARTAFAAKAGENFIFDRMGFSAAVKGRNVLIVEDISTSGDTTGKVSRLVEACDGTVVGISFIWIRGNVDAKVLGVPRTHALITERIKTFDTDVATPDGWGELPLVDDIGHPEHFPDYQPRIDLLAA